MNNKPAYEELAKRLAEAEDIIEALRNQEVDAVVGKKNVLMLRLKETEDQLKKERDRLALLLRERDTLLQDLKQRSAELEAANQELESFSYSVSHDLKAPLRTLDGFSEAVLSEYGDKLDETGKDYLERVKKASQNMSQMIEDLLKLSHVTRADMDICNVNLTDLAGSIVDELKSMQPDRQVEFIIVPDMKASGDRQLLKILLRNLMENSWKYTSQSSDARIELGFISQEDNIAYFVKDNGIGFDMKYAEKLFQPFQRLHNNKDYPGTGIGLATAQRVIRKHGGRIWAESEIGQGATFYFTLG